MVADMQMEVEAARIAGKVQAIQNNVSKVIIGKEEVFQKIMAAFLAGGNVLLEDMPGTGKTKLAKALAASLDAEFGRIQFTPDLLPSDVTGLNIYRQDKGAFEFTAGPVFCNILLADEINRATPRTQSSLLECMEERQVTVDGVTRPMKRPFFLIATQNPVETAGTYPLPEAQIDRFAMQLSMGYPAMEEELMIIDRYRAQDPLAELTPVCSCEEVLQMQETCRQIYVSESVGKYLVQIIQATREHPSLMMGVNPRGTLSYLHCVQAYAAIRGREYVTPDDVKELCIPVLGHRIMSYRTGQGGSTGEILEEILGRIPVPTEEWTR